jgi:hypothetical protein
MTDAYERGIGVECFGRPDDLIKRPLIIERLGGRSIPVLMAVSNLFCFSQ